MITDDIRKRLQALSDEKYRDFQIPVIATVRADRVIGVRTPELRKLAKEISKREDIGDFLSTLPHDYFDEDQLHAFVISGMKDYDECIRQLDRFLPYVDNWATCDQMSPKVFAKNRAALIPKTDEWLSSGHTYTVRFGIGMLMEHFLDDDFDVKYLKKVAAIRSDEYYINMMIAWYFATALAKQYETALPFIEGQKMDAWTHNKAIQKCVESNRIRPEQKEYLKKLKIKK
ncbi:MAG: DNA alkylation repair protein [Lachnospiraceae bacterium]|nr:DNA alkylation repair protein [Lachnospiraceae bacterium]